MIKAILFDMDGVLIDAKDWHFDAFNHALSLFGMEISRTEHLMVYDGLPTREKLRILTKVHGLPTRLHGFLNEIKQRRTVELTVEKCRPVFQHQYALSRFKREGTKIVVCSNSIRPTVKLMMEKSGLLHYLDFYLSNQDVSQPKPDPEIYTTAIKRLQLTQNEVLIVEDNEHGIRAARASGGHVMEVSTVEDVTYESIAGRIATIDGGTR